MFNVSDKVICIDDRFDSKIINYCSGLPKMGLTYVVRGINIYNNKINVLLCGITCSPIENSGIEAGFKEERFRKLDELKNKTKNYDFNQSPQ